MFLNLANRRAWRASYVVNIRLLVARHVTNGRLLLAAELRRMHIVAFFVWPFKHGARASEVD